MKNQMKFQKAVISIATILAAVLFFYALGFSTNLYYLSGYANPTSSNYVEGAELYKTVQGFNQGLFTNSILLILTCVVMFIFFTHKRRIYYISNYVFSSVFTLYSIILGLYSMINIINYKATYAAIDFAEYKLRELNAGGVFMTSNAIFNIGLVISALVILIGLFVLINMLWKARLTSKEKKLRAESFETGDDDFDYDDDFGDDFDDDDFGDDDYDEDVVKKNAEEKAKLQEEKAKLKEEKAKAKAEKEKIKQDKKSKKSDNSQEISSEAIDEDKSDEE